MSRRISDLDLDFYAIIGATWKQWEADAQEQYAQDVESGHTILSYKAQYANNRPR
jgi:hypothetical protein